MLIIHTFFQIIFKFIRYLKKMEDNTFGLTRAKTAVRPKQHRSFSVTDKRASSAKNQARNSRNTVKFHYIVKDYNQFGASTPRWTIPSSRKGPKPPPDYPPPGQYDVPLEPFNQKYHHSIQEREITDYRTITSNIDYIYHPYFPKKDSFKHNFVPTVPDDEKKISFIGKSDSPGPGYNIREVQPRTDYYKKHNIGKHEPPKEPIVESSPSPQDYSPVIVSLPRSPAYSFEKIVVSDEGKPARPVDLGTPGPGAYNVGPQVRRPPRWAEKLTVHSTRRRKANIDIEQPKASESFSYIEYETLV